MELIASPSSALLSLLMQQVSTQTYPRPSRRACAQVDLIFWKPAPFSSLDGLLNSANVTSSGPHVCDRIAYGGRLAGNHLRANVSQSMRYMISKTVMVRSYLVNEMINAQG